MLQMEEIIPILHKFFQKTKVKRMLVNLFYKPNITLNIKSDKNITRKLEMKISHKQKCEILNKYE